MPDSARSEDVVLCLNAGSSSLKFALFRVTKDEEEQLTAGSIEGPQGAENPLEAVFRQLDERALPEPSLVGHRVVHGGQAHLRPTRVDGALIESLQSLTPLAPLHLPACIQGIQAALSHLPKTPQVACFDTGFHATLPEYAARFAIPHGLFQEGLRRYGFHGLSYEYVLSTLGNPPPARLIVAHLGNGASLAAIKDGVSVDTSMGLTPGGGILMGTRSGDLDPGLILYLLREKGYSADALEDLLERKSGLLGIAGSADMRELSSRHATDPLAELSITMMGYAVRKTIGAYVAVLGGVDVLVFTGGIGEHAPLIREEACRGLGVFGIALDSAKNTAGDAELQASEGACRILVVKTDEDRMIARHTRALIR